MSEVVTNPFEQTADRQRHAASKAKERAYEKRLAKLVVKSDADAPMVVSEREREQFEKSKQLGFYRQWLRERREALVNGPYGKDLAGLLQLLDSLTLDSAPALVRLVQTAKWMKRADVDTRHEILTLISTAIIRLRKRNGLSPFDDSMPFTDEPPTAFEVIRYELTGVGQSPVCEALV